MVFRLFTLNISLLASPPPLVRVNVSQVHSLTYSTIPPTLVGRVDQLDFIVYAGGLLKVKCFICLPHFLRLGICFHELHSVPIPYNPPTILPTVYPRLSFSETQHSTGSEYLLSFTHFLPLPLRLFIFYSDPPEINRTPLWDCTHPHE